MTPSASSDRPRARDDVVFRQLDEEWVLFDPVADRLHTLNLTAAFVWAHLSGEATVEEVAASVSRAFDQRVSADEVLPDVLEAVGRFQQEGLLE
jgi:hypothetical protein